MSQIYRFGLQVKRLLLLDFYDILCYALADAAVSLFNSAHNSVAPELIIDRASSRSRSHRSRQRRIEGATNDNQIFIHR